MSKKKHKTGMMPDFGDCQDLEIMQQTMAWLLSEQNDLNRSFRNATTIEETSKLQGRASVIDAMLKRFKVSKNSIIKDEDDNAKPSKQDKYAC